MATIEKIDKELNDAKVRLDEAMKNLKTFEEGENDGKWLNELRGKVRSNNLSEGEERQLVRLEEAKKSLVEIKERWEKQVEEWGTKFREVGGGEGNEQIA